MIDGITQQEAAETYNAFCNRGLYSPFGEYASIEEFIESNQKNQDSVDIDRIVQYFPPVVTANWRADWEYAVVAGKAMDRAWILCRYLKDGFVEGVELQRNWRETVAAFHKEDSEYLQMAAIDAHNGIENDYYGADYD